METQTEQIIVKDPKQKENILKVVDESIIAGKEQNWTYSNISQEHKVLENVSRLKDLIEEKKKLFERLDDKSYTYERILDTAKLALKKLKEDGDFNYYSAELILKFSQLEEVFMDKKLTSKGVRFIEHEEVKRVPTLGLQIHKEQKTSGEVEGTEKFIGEKITGERLKRLKEKEKEDEIKKQAIKDFDFDALDEDMTESSDSAGEVNEEDVPEVDKEDLDDAMDNL